MEQLSYQRQQFGCGFACVRMALAFYSFSRDALSIDEPRLETPPTLADIVSYAATYGLRLGAYRGDLSSAPKGSLLVLYGDKGSHMAFFIGKKGKRYLLLDPDSGRLALTEETLGEIYAGMYLQKESIETPSYHFTPAYSLCFDRWMILLACSSFLPNALMLASLFLLSKEDIHIGISIALLVLSLLSSAFSRFLILSMMKRFDKRFLETKRDKNGRAWHDSFVHYQSYKGLLFSCIPQFCACLATLVSSACLLSFLDPFLGISIVVGVMILAIFYFLNRRRRLEIESDLIIAERRLAIPFEEDKAPILRRIVRMSDLYGRHFLSAELVCVALAMCFAVLTLLLESRLSAGNLFIYGISLYYCFISATRCATFERNLERQKKEEAYFLYDFVRHE